ncbi:MAG TPA: LacI family DNA-binding transcriptional regulator [Chloroflexota bacterium]|nr:LacI family DNA-binding transcriptional regulator [Chloroflexota bacterium]
MSTGAGVREGTSIKDVSRAAGVSISTVSHVLNGTRYVSAELRRRVEEAISRLDYRHNGLARSLRTRRSYAVGLIIPDVTNPYYPQIARGVQDTAAAAGYWVFLCNSDRRPETEVRLLTALEQRRVDGVLLDASWPTPDLLQAIRRAAVPVVLVGSRIDEPDLDVVTVAPNGGLEAVRHLIGAGHRRIGLIGGPPVGPPVSGGTRLAKAGGYLLALEEAGLPLDPQLIVQGDYTREGGAAAMERLLALPEPPTAVFAGNDLMAIGALAAARRAGRRVPQDVAVVGYDDIPEAAATTPALTTVAVPKYEMGTAAATLLLERLAVRHDRHERPGPGDSFGPGGVAPGMGSDSSPAPLAARIPRAAGAALGPRHVELPYRLVVRESA